MLGRPVRTGTQEPLECCERRSRGGGRVEGGGWEDEANVGITIAGSQSSTHCAGEDFVVDAPLHAIMRRHTALRVRVTMLVRLFCYLVEGARRSGGNVSDKTHRHVVGAMPTTVLITTGRGGAASKLLGMDSFHPDCFKEARKRKGQIPLPHKC